MNRVVFLDRDNTLIHNDGDLGDPSQVRLIQGVASAVASLRGLGYRIVVVSNQGGVARGKYTEADVQATNAKINQLIRETSGASIDRFYYCPYHPQGSVEKYAKEHSWRKPQPGMLLAAARDMDADLSQSWTIGDQMRDVQAGAAAGTRTILLTPQASMAQPPLLQEKAAAELMGKTSDTSAVLPDFVARNLIEAVRIVAQQRRPEGVDDWRALEHATVAKNRPAAAAAGSSSSAVAGSSVTVRTLATPVPLSPVSSSHPPVIEPLPVPSVESATSGEPVIVTTSVVLAASESSLEAKDDDAKLAGGDSLTLPFPGTIVLGTSAGGGAIEIAETQKVSVVSDSSAGRGALARPGAEAGEVSAVGEPVIQGGEQSKPVAGAVSAVVTTVAASSQVEEVSGEASSALSSVAGSQAALPNSSTAHRAVKEGVSPPNAEQTLRQILQEMRNQRRLHDEFDYLSLLAIVFQLLAIVCLLAGMWIGRGQDLAFFRWWAVAMIVQLATIAMLLFRR